ncbi:plasmid mobilization protein [Amorphus orientalis]|uniref:Bacterial mobilisation domain-containing protein n=1 Tax=Amorphus orientalis TaxID=649198 RepID=A0AAE3VNF1_9HYPH|nr:plasmid mobilization relaxosome protein MobC [Amorphus orientalis]MDQ0314886.1 hypothetical protein [Amorphus orientalis]
MGRGSETRKRGRLLQVRLAAEELAEVRERADRAGLTPASYVRQTVLDGPLPRQVPRPPASRVELAQLLGHVGKLGSNVNQLARAVNRGQVATLDPMRLAEIQDELEEIRTALMVALGRDPG